MIRSTPALAIVIPTLLLAGCSTKPRNFSAQLSAPVASRATFESDFRTCQQLVRGGARSDFKAKAAVGLAAAAGTVGTAVVITSTTTMIPSGFLATGTTTAAGGGAMAAAAVLPGAGLLLGFGVSRIIRGSRERSYQRRMNACLTDYGYSVERWAKVRKKDDAANISAAAATERLPAITAPEGQTALTPVSAQVLP